MAGANFCDLHDHGKRIRYCGNRTGPAPDHTELGLTGTAARVALAM